ncbi:UPF0565 domain containing protein [Trichuris trichiura]|uniref:UPF0565 domain containing protein n=1 Tax=Trichuris trichiura TaxID=36087 RepID=A0A077YZ78_TRITR|nr:UPF0565 domain containing protein [Trichuris trichiura]
MQCYRVLFFALCKVLSNRAGANSGDMSALENVRLFRLNNVHGNGNRRNDILYCHSGHVDRFDSLVVFFPGDVQDYRQAMECHSENREFLRWNLEDVASMLLRQFPTSLLFVVKASQVTNGTFACYKNFVTSNHVGIPQFSDNYGSWKHLESLIANAIEQSRFPSSRLPITLIGFSKGCVVLNQLVYELSEAWKESSSFISEIKAICWLDGGHAGQNSTWLTDSSRLKILVRKMSNCKFQVDVSPYQVRDCSRPWIGRQENQFVQLMMAAGADIRVFMHFENEKPSIENHFRVIEQFRPFWLSYLVAETMINEYELAFTATQWAVVQDELPFCGSDSEGARQGNVTNATGGYVGDNYAWINNGSSVMVYHISSLREVASWFAESESVIASVCVYSMNASDYALLLAVNGVNGNDVLAFDILSNTVVQLFTVPEEIVCLEPVRWPGQNLSVWENCQDRNFARAESIVAVSTMQGHVYMFGKAAYNHELSKNRRSSFWSVSVTSNQSKNTWTELVDLIDTSVCSALLFSQQTMILALGFNFGCVLLYHVLFDAFSFVWSVAEDGHEVTNFCLVEPEENPRNVIYLIVSKYGRLLSGYFGAEIQVVDLQFVHKSRLDDGNNVYSDFVGTRESFSMRAEDCEKFLIRTTKKKAFHEEGEADGFSPSVYFLSSSAGGDVFAFFFDVNSWYHAQTPGSISSGYLGLCQFMNMHRYNYLPTVLDFMVSPFVTVEHRHLLEPDFIYYPCNYSLSVQLLTTKGLVNCTFQSLQEKAFAKVEADPTICTDAHRSLEELQSAGLIERNPMLLLANEDDKILRVWSCMLSAKRVNYFLNFLNLQIIEPSVLKLLKNWAWQYGIRSKRMVQEIAMDHLDYGNEIVPDLHRKLSSCQKSIEILVMVHGCLINAGRAFCEEDKAQYEAMVLINLYVRVVAWFLRQQSQLFASIGSCSHKVDYGASSVRDSPVLFARKFTELLTSQLEGCLPKAVFPPASLEELLRIYLLPSLDLRTKHFAVFYVLLEKLVHCECDNSSRQMAELVNLFEKQILNETDPSLAKYAWYSILIDHGEDRQAESWLLRAIMSSSSASFNFWTTFLSYFNYKLPLPQFLLPSQPEQTATKVPFKETFSNLFGNDSWLLANPFICGTIENTTGFRLLSCSKTMTINRTDVEQEEVSPANHLIERLPEVQGVAYANLARSQSQCTDAMPTQVARTQTNTAVRECFAVVNALKEKVCDLLPEISYAAPDVTYGLTKGDGSQLVPSEVARMRQNRKRCAALLDVANSSVAARLGGNDTSSPMTKRKKLGLVDLRHHRNFWDALLTFSRPRRHRPASLASPSSLTPVLSKRCAGGSRPSSSRSVEKRVRFNLANEIDGERPGRKAMTTPLISPLRRARSKSETFRNTEMSSDQEDDDEDFSVYADIIREINSNKSSVQWKPRFPPASTSANEMEPVGSARTPLENNAITVVENTLAKSSSIAEQESPKNRSSISAAPEHAVATLEEHTAAQNATGVKPLSQSNSRSKSADKKVPAEKKKLRGAGKPKSPAASKDVAEEAFPTQPEENRIGSTRYYLRSLKKRRSLNDEQPGHSRRR